MAESTPKSYSSDPALYIYTSLTSGSSHIVTATSRMETILRANRIPFKALDIATDEKARMLWGRRAGKDEGGRPRKMPGLVQMGLVIGDLVEVEDWNEYGELKQHVTIYYDDFTTPSKPLAIKSTAPTPSGTPSKPSANQKENQALSSPAAKSTPSSLPKPVVDQKENLPSDATQSASITLALRQVGQEAAQKANEAKKKVVETFVGVGTTSPKKEEAKDEVEEEEAEEDNNEDESDSDSPTTPTTKQSAQHSIDTLTLAQSPTSTAWKRELHIPIVQSIISSPPTTVDKLESLQSPNSTAWKPTDVDMPTTTLRGSTVSEASADCIKKVEEDQTILEEDEDSSED